MHTEKWIMNGEQWTQLFYGDFFIQVARFPVKTSNHFPIAATPVTNCFPVAEAKWPAFFTTSLNFSSNSFLVGFVVSTKKTWDGCQKDSIVYWYILLEFAVSDVDPMLKFRVLVPKLYSKNGTHFAPPTGCKISPHQRSSKIHQKIL